MIIVYIFLIMTVVFFIIGFSSGVYVNVRAYQLKRHLGAIGKEDYVTKAGLFAPLRYLCPEGVTTEQEQHYLISLRHSMKVFRLALVGAGAGFVLLVLSSLVFFRA